MTGRDWRLAKNAVNLKLKREDPIHAPKKINLGQWWLSPSNRNGCVGSAGGSSGGWELETGLAVKKGCDIPNAMESPNALMF